MPWVPAALHHSSMIAKTTSAPSPTPPLTQMLGMLQPGSDIPDEVALTAAITAAVDCGFIDSEAHGDSLTALQAMCRHAAHDPSAPGVRSVRFSRSAIQRSAIAILSSVSVLSADDFLQAYSASDFATCLGPTPREVELRMRAAENPRLAPTVLATAADHLAFAIIDLATRLPGARVTPEGDVIWPYFASCADDAEALSWLALPGPGVFASADTQEENNDG